MLKQSKASEGNNQVIKNNLHQSRFLIDPSRKCFYRQYVSDYPWFLCCNWIFIVDGSMMEYSHTLPPYLKVFVASETATSTQHSEWVTILWTPSILQQIHTNLCFEVLLTCHWGIFRQFSILHCKKEGLFCLNLVTSVSYLFCIIKYGGNPLPTLHSKQWLDFLEH